MRRPRRPRSKRGLIAAIGGTVTVVVVAAFALIYFVIFPTSSPPPFALKTTARSAPVGSAAKLSGNWTIAAGSQAGYSVREKLAFLPATGSGGYDGALGS